MPNFQPPRRGMNMGQDEGLNSRGGRGGQGRGRGGGRGRAPARHNSGGMNFSTNLMLFFLNFKNNL